MEDRERGPHRDQRPDGGDAGEQRGRELLDRALAGFADQISLLKQAAIIATGANLTLSVMAA